MCFIALTPSPADQQSGPTCPPMSGPSTSVSPSSRCTLSERLPVLPTSGTTSISSGRTSRRFPKSTKHCKLIKQRISMGVHSRSTKSSLKDAYIQKTSHPGNVSVHKPTPPGNPSMPKPWPPSLPFWRLFELPVPRPFLHAQHRPPS